MPLWALLGSPPDRLTKLFVGRAGNPVTKRRDFAQNAQPATVNETNNADAVSRVRIMHFEISSCLISTSTQFPNHQKSYITDRSRQSSAGCTKRKIGNGFVGATGIPARPPDQAICRAGGEPVTLQTVVKKRIWKANSKLTVPDS